MMNTLPREWVATLDNRYDLDTDPDAHAAKLVRMAFECRRRCQVDDLQLSEMLEMAEAARLFGNMEHEELFECGVFGNHHVPDNQWGYGLSPEFRETLAVAARSAADFPPKK